MAKKICIISVLFLSSVARGATYEECVTHLKEFVPESSAQEIQLNCGSPPISVTLKRLTSVNQRLGASQSG